MNAQQTMVAVLPVACVRCKPASCDGGGVAATLPQTDRQIDRGTDVAAARW